MWALRNLTKTKSLTISGKGLDNFFTAYFLFAWPEANHVFTVYLYPA